jgi:hypothetical protein
VAWAASGFSQDGFDRLGSLVSLGLGPLGHLVRVGAWSDCDRALVCLRQLAVAKAVTQEEGAAALERPDELELDQALTL